MHKYDWSPVYGFPSQCVLAGELANSTRVKGAIYKIIIAGMGGSALPGDILSCLYGSQLKIFINRNYTLPDWADENTLVFVISYSGNTEETLSAIQDSVKKKCKTIGIACGGKLEHYCARNKIPFILVPSGLQPRDALGYQTLPVIHILKNSKLISEKNTVENAIQGTLHEMNKVSEKIAKELKGKIPIIYSSQEMYGMARIAKIKINENAKQPSFWNVFPELNHNEMQGFTKLNGKYSFVFIQDQEDHARIKKRMKVTQKILQEKGLPVQLIKLKGKTKIERLFYGIHLFNYVSYYLAEYTNVNPTPVPMVETFKKKMNE